MKTAKAATNEKTHSIRNSHTRMNNEIQEAYDTINSKLQIVVDEKTNSVGIYVKLSDCIEFTRKMVAATQRQTEDYIIS